MVDMPRAPLTRRDVLRGAVGVAALGAAGGVAPSVLRPGTARAAGVPISMAMHVHACFSEGIGSMESHLVQAEATGIDVLWWSEHDQRMSAYGARAAVHFDGPAETSEGTTWRWAASTVGSLSSSSVTWVASPASPADPAGAGAVRLRAVGGGTGFGQRRLNGSQTGTLSRGSLAGTTIQLDVRPVSVGPNAWIGLVLTTSHRPAREGRPSGRYLLTYRVGGPGAVGSRVSEGLTGVVTLAAPLDVWTTLTLDPVADLEAIWPGVDGRDASMVDVAVAAASREGQPAEGYLDYLRFTRTGRLGDEPLALQRSMMARYATQFPGVVQQQGLEVSTLREHLGWYGGALSLPAVTAPPGKKNTSAAAFRAQAEAIRAAGGAASFNHPFGTSTAVRSSAAQEAARRAMATELITQRAYGCDLLEVGYPVRGGVDLARHLALWDALSRNAVFVSGTGVSDDHSGTDWLGQRLNFWTWVWATSTATGALVDALRAGRAYCGNPKAFRGELDLIVDGTVLMGQADVADVPTRQLRIAATDVPAGGRVDVVRGLVDLAGPTVPDPVVVRTSLPASAFAAGSADVAIDTTASRFVRVEVRTSTGSIVALSNPVWLLRSAPPLGIPAVRRR